jgi:hypothetical protein
MRLALACLLALHGAIHLLGFVKSIRPAAVPGLRQPIALPLGVLWLVTALLLAGAAAMVLAGARAWWGPALAGIVLSQLLVVAAWRDARFGTLANLIVLVPVLVVVLDFRPGSLRSLFGREVHAALAQPVDATLVTEADLAPLPAPVQRWLRRAGVVGRARVSNFHAVLRAEMRGAPDAPWMTARADHWEFFHPAERLFYMTAERAGVPIAVLHRYVGDGATMEGRIAGLVPIIDVRGRDMTQAETVTLLNDMCVLAPAALVDAPIAWETLDDRTVRATYANAGHRVSALLHFDATGDLADFRSDDRFMLDGDSLRRLPWTTPLADYRDFGGVRLAARGEARWTDGGRTWAYGRFVLERIEYNVAALRAAAIGN